MRKYFLILIFFETGLLFAQSFTVIELLQKTVDEIPAERIAAWRNVSGVLVDNPDNKKHIAGFLEQMMFERLGKRITAKNTDIPVLVNFLKTFSKEEAVHILHIWIQANINPTKVNGIYAPPEIFIRNKTGDCTEVAWLAETVCKELGMETKVFVAVYRFDYSFKNYVAAHAFTGLDFTENNKNKRYIIDNRNLHELAPQDYWKNIIWQIYSRESEVWRYREVNTSLWRNVKSDTDDPQMRAMNMFVIYAPIPQDIAVKEFEGYNLSEFFDDPAQETLFFRDDFRQTIAEQKETGKITEKEYDRLLNLWRRYENTGMKKYY